MEDSSKTIKIGERYRRRSGRVREYAWVTGHAHGGVSYRHSSGLASVPEAQFLRMFELAPKRQKRGE